MIFIDACFNRPTAYTPVWMMRQAGRYLPEYRAVRQDAENFLSLCRDYKKASQVTLQPVDILGVDAAILFSDILVIPLEMGMDLKFVNTLGPVFDNPLSKMDDLDKLSIEKASKNLSYVYDAIKLTRDKLSPDKALIGFCGAPWTLATYMIEGGTSKTYNISKKMLYDKPQFLHAILRKVTSTLKIYLEEQIKAGVNAIQIFDSWANALEEKAYLEFGLSYVNELVDFIKERYPDIPIIVFPKGVGGFIDRINGKFDVFGLDWSTPLRLAKEKLGDKFVIQGNMEPMRLYNKDAIDDGVDEILSIMKCKKHIFNLGHGILPDIPVENAKYFIKSVQEKSAKFAK